MSVTIPKFLFPVPGIIPSGLTKAISFTEPVSFTFKVILFPISLAIIPSDPFSIATFKSFESPTVKPTSPNLTMLEKALEPDLM